MAGGVPFDNPLTGLSRYDLSPYSDTVVHGGLAFLPAFGRVIDGNSRHLSMATLVLRQVQWEAVICYGMCSAGGQLV